MPQVGNGYRPPYNQAYVENFEEFRVRYVLFYALDDVVCYAVIASKNKGRYKSQQFLGLTGKCAIIVHLSIEIEKPLNPQVSPREDLLVHLLSIPFEILQCMFVAHFRSLTHFRRSKYYKSILMIRFAHGGPGEI